MSAQPRQLLRQLRRLRQPASAELLAGLEWLQTLDQRDSLAMLQQPQLHLLAAAGCAGALCGGSVHRLSHGRRFFRTGKNAAATPVIWHLWMFLRNWRRRFADFWRRRANFAANPPVAAELEKKAVAASFSRAAAVYDSVAHLQREVGVQLLTRLERLPGVPATILDLGCGTGYFYPALRERYPRSAIPRP